MAGRINDEDVVAVRERARIEDVVGSYIALRNAGGGSMKGLCPFHDEKTPSFQVTPARGFYYCFGCGEGGDAIAFVQKVEHLTFTEAVERLALRIGMEVRHEDGGTGRRDDVGDRGDRPDVLELEVGRVLEVDVGVPQGVEQQLPAAVALRVGHDAGAVVGGLLLARRGRDRREPEPGDDEG